MWALYVDTGVIFIHFVCIVHYNTRFDIDILNGGTPYEHFSPPLLPPPHTHTPSVLDICNCSINPIQSKLF